jgi:hypothetical protein
MRSGCEQHEKTLGKRKMSSAAHKKKMKQKKYFFNKKLFRIYCLVIVLYMFFVLYKMVSVGGYFYVECPTSSVSLCDNFFYESKYCNPSTLQNLMQPMLKTWATKNGLCDVDKESLFPGESYGTKAPWYVSDMFLFIGAPLLGLVLFNHFKYNKDYEFKDEKDKED